MDGQAEMAPLSADDVAQFLIDNPEADGADDQQEQVPTDESTSTEDTDESETDDDSPDDADDESDEQPDPTSGRKYKVTVKGEDGADLEQEVDEKNLSQATSGTRITPARPQSLRGEKSRPWRSCAPRFRGAEPLRATGADGTGAGGSSRWIAQPRGDAGAVPPRPCGLCRRTGQAAAGAQHDCWPAKPVAARAVPRTARPARSLATELRALLGCAGAEGHRQAQAAAHFETVSKDYGISPGSFRHLNDPAVGHGDEGRRLTRSCKRKD